MVSVNTSPDVVEALEPQGSWSEPLIRRFCYKSRVIPGGFRRCAQGVRTVVLMVSDIRVRRGDGC